MREAEFKAQAKRLRAYLSEQDIDINHSRALEAVARVHGFRDWNTAAASLPKEGPVEIIVTGRKFVRVSGEPITFTDVVVMAYGRLPPHFEYLTMTYRGRTVMGSMLHPTAEPVLAEEGLVFSVADTSNA